MKLTTFFILLMFVPEFAMAQELVAATDTSSSIKEQAARNTSAIPANDAPIELNAFHSGSKFAAVPDPAGETQQTRLAERGFMDNWRERMFKAISEHLGPRQQDPLQAGRMLTDDELDQQASEGRTVMRLVLKETLKFSKEHIVEIDRLVKALKYEVSTDKAANEEADAETNGIKTVDRKITDKIATERTAGDTHSAKSPVVSDKVVLKTGVRVRIDSGKPGLVSETAASYGKASYFYRVNLDNQGDNSLGLRYVLGRNIYLQVERDFNHTMDPAASDKPSTNLIQLGYRF
jgi:hypothetical protein